MRHFCSLLLLLSVPAAFAQMPAQTTHASVDAIWSARYVVTMDAQRRVIENGAVAIAGDHIVDVGTRADIDRRYTRKTAARPPGRDPCAGPYQHAYPCGHVAIPRDRGRYEPAGVAHQIHFSRGGQERRPRVRALGDSSGAARDGAVRHHDLHGHVLFRRHGGGGHQAGRDARSAGRNRSLDFPAPDYKTPQASLAATEQLFKQYANDPLIVPAVAPHAIYTVPNDVLQAARALANRYQKPLEIHVSETKTENDEALAKRHMTPTAALESLGVLNGWTLAAHGVWLTDADMAILKRRDTGLAHNPSSNMKLASGVARVGKILSLGIPMGLGTDGVAGSNNDHDMMEEMDLAAKLQKVTTGDPRALPAMQAVEMATITGARALHMDKLIGSLEKNKRADMITISLAGAHAVPIYNVYSQIVYALKGSDITDVMVNGRSIVRDRRMLTLDARPIMLKAAEYQERVKKSLGMK